VKSAPPKPGGPEAKIYGAYMVQKSVMELTIVQLYLNAETKPK